MERESRFGRTRAKKWIRFRNSCATLAGKTLRGRKFARTTVRVITPSFSKTPMATSWKFVAARSRYLPLDLWRQPCRLRLIVDFFVKTDTLGPAVTVDYFSGNGGICRPCK